MRDKAMSLSEVYPLLVPEYASYSRKNMIFKFKWNKAYADQVLSINPKRGTDRICNYISVVELARVKRILTTKDNASIRFGVMKPGKGYHGDRGDFCLIGAAIDGKHLTLMYRSLELIGGFAYDLCLIEHISEWLEITWSDVTIFAASARVFALRRNSNEKLYPKLRKIFV